MILSAIEQLKQLLFHNANVSDENLRRKSIALHRAIPLIAQGLVEKRGHKIRVVNSSTVIGHTDGDTITLTHGVMPTDNQDLATYLVYVALKLGLLHHEVGHVNESQFDLDILQPKKGRKSSAASKTAAQYPAILPYLLNIIEDVRMENAHIRRYRSSRSYLDGLSLASIITGMNAAPAADEPIAGIFSSYLLYSLRAHVRNEPHFLEFAEVSRGLLVQKIGLPVVARLDAQIPRAAHLSDTSSALSMAQDLYRILEAELADQQEQQKNAAASSGTATQSDADSNASPDEDSAEDTAESASDQSHAETTAPGSESGASTICASLEELLSSDGSDAKGDMDEAVRMHIAKLDRAMRKKGDVAEDDVDMESILAATPATTSELKLSTESADFAPALSTVGRLSAKLKMRLQANAIVKTARSKTGGKLDKRRLIKAALGDTRIFRRSTQGVDCNAAVFLLGDVSGSMDSQHDGVKRITVSNQALYASAVALQRLPSVEVAVGTFPGRQMVLRFGQRAIQHQARFNLATHGLTPLDEGMLMATAALSFSSKPRKLLVVITDGEADSNDLARASIDHALSLGIEVYAIGVCTESVRDLFASCSVINTVSDLPEALISVLSQRLDAPLDMAA